MSGLAEAPLRGLPRDNPNEGHRERLRRRYREAGAPALADHELVELYLFEFIPRADTKAIAKALLARFGNLEGVLNATALELRGVKGIGPKVADSMSVLSAIHRRSLENAAYEKVMLSSWRDVHAYLKAELGEYLRAEMGFLPREQFRVLFLNKKNALIANEVLGNGTVDHTPAYPREVIKRAIELSATAIVLVHNHPSGDPTPSRADVEMTKQIVEAGKPLGLVVHDHVVMGRDGHASLRGLGLMG